MPGHPLRPLLVALLVSFASLASFPAYAQDPQPVPAHFEAPEILDFVHADLPEGIDPDDLPATVTLEILVDVAGASADVKVVVPSGNPLLDDAAVAAARRFKWKP